MGLFHDRDILSPWTSKDFLCSAMELFVLHFVIQFKNEMEKKNEKVFADATLIFPGSFRLYG